MSGMVTELEKGRPIDKKGDAEKLKFIEEKFEAARAYAPKESKEEGGVSRKG